MRQAGSRSYCDNHASVAFVFVTASVKDILNTTTDFIVVLIASSDYY